MRKLASVQLVESISPIEGADNIEKATILGWSCVVKKGEFKPGDLCVYFEIDSFLPIRPEFEFLRKSSFKRLPDGTEGFRLKTIKLKGQVSQGLALPLSSVIPILQSKFATVTDVGTITLSDEYYERNLVAGYDLSVDLCVIKYEPPIPVQLQGKVKGYFPSFIRKTDQERVQNIWHKIKDLDERFEVTVKLDGMSCTYYLNNGVFGVCSRNMELEENEGNTFWKLARKYDIEKSLRLLGKNIALQGEVIGEGIQGNKENIKGQDFYLFDIFDIDNQRYLSPWSRWDVFCFLRRCDFPLPYFEHVDVLSRGCKRSMFNSIDDILSYANGPSINSPVREGIVFKSLTTDLTFKVISNEYLLKNED